MRRRERNTLLVLGLLFLVFGGLGTASAKPATRKKRLSRDELEELARRAGFDDPVFAASIALRESGGDPSAVNDTRGRTDLPPGTTNEHSIGLWQINLLAWPQYTKDELLDPEKNARAAREIQRRQGWAPWSTARATPPPATSPPPAPPPATPPPTVTPGPPADPPEPTVTPVGPAD
jgi:Lysozyme like domain